MWKHGEPGRACATVLTLSRKCNDVDAGRPGGGSPVSGCSWPSNGLGMMLSGASQCGKAGNRLSPRGLPVPGAADVRGSGLDWRRACRCRNQSAAGMTPGGAWLNHPCRCSTCIPVPVHCFVIIRLFDGGDAAAGGLDRVAVEPVDQAAKHPAAASPSHTGPVTQAGRRKHGYG
jgi:hypothetical protein